MFNTIPEILEDLKSGRMVIVLDDEGRENEGDLIMSAEHLKPEDINFMAKHGRGLICVPMEEARLKELTLFPMAGVYEETIVRQKDNFNTAWMISVDARYGITTGISAFDRTQTIKALIDPKTKPQDLIRPGHVFPLKASSGGVLVRAGHTEACVDLMRLSKAYPAGVICEIMNDDGTMARTMQLIEFAKQFNLKICTIAALIEYRRKKEKLVRRISQTQLPTIYGEFKLILYESQIDQMYHLALVSGDVERAKSAVLVRVHSGCLTGDVFGSLRCDCGEQLHSSLSAIQKEKCGVLLYMNQEGRGIGLVNKIHAYALQDIGLDTVQANEALGLAADLRDYGIGAQILVDLNIRKIRLLTNNPRKIVGLEGYGLEVVQRVPITVDPNPKNLNYLKTKKEKLGHIL